MSRPRPVLSPVPLRRLRLLVLAVALGLSMLTACDDGGGDGETHWSDDASSGDTTSARDTWSGGGGADTSAPSDTGSWSWDDTQAADTSPSDGWSGSADATSDTGTPGGNTNVSLGGAQDFGYFRRLLDDGVVPTPEAMEAAGFFAEHHTPLPAPVCGERVCVQAMLGVMGNLVDGSSCTMLQLGLNSPIEVDPAQRPPLSLSVVVDVSGSMMADGKIEFVRQGLLRMVNALDDTDQLALVLYESSATRVFPMQPIAGQRNTLSDLIAGLTAGGGTNLYAGLELGYQESFAHYDSGRQNRVLLLSDGNASAGITAPAQILAMSRAFNSDGVGLTTIGLGTDFDYTLMRDLALQADGNFYFVEDSSAVDEVFAEELSYFTVPVAYDVTLALAVGEDYAVGAAHGSPLWRPRPTAVSSRCPACSSRTAPPTTTSRPTAAAAAAARRCSSS